MPSSRGAAAASRRSSSTLPMLYNAEGGRSALRQAQTQVTELERQLDEQRSALEKEQRIHCKAKLANRELKREVEGLWKVMRKDDSLWHELSGLRKQVDGVEELKAGLLQEGKERQEADKAVMRTFEDSIADLRQEHASLKVVSKLDKQALEQAQKRIATLEAQLQRLLELNAEISEENARHWATLGKDENIYDTQHALKAEIKRAHHETKQVEGQVVPLQRKLKATKKQAEREHGQLWAWKLALQNEERKKKELEAKVAQLEHELRVARLEVQAANVQHKKIADRHGRVIAGHKSRRSSAMLTFPTLTGATASLIEAVEAQKTGAESKNLDSLKATVLEALDGDSAMGNPDCLAALEPSASLGREDGMDGWQEVIQKMAARHEAEVAGLRAQLDELKEVARQRDDLRNLAGLCAKPPHEQYEMVTAQLKAKGVLKLHSRHERSVGNL